jgi:hypothetical protein
VEISCQFLPPGGSMIPRYVLQLLSCKNYKIAKNSNTTAREKISTDLESLEFFDVCLTNFKNTQIL